jgi:hypothetical protein
VIAPVPAAIRAVLLLAGVALLVLPGALHPIPFALTALGVAAAVAAPRLVGSLFATIGFVFAWLAAAGWSGDMPVGRTVAAAAALYVLQVTAALAAGVPIDARVERAVLWRWARQCLPPVLAASALIALDEALPQRAGTPWYELAGLLGVLVVGAAGFYVVRRRDPATARMDGRAPGD